jgi:hypothetical protein
MTNDVIRAVERLRRMRDDAASHDGGYPATEDGRMQSLLDHCAIAQAALPLFDPDPITEQWLRSMGGEIENYEPEDGSTVAFRSDFGGSADEPETYGLSVFCDGTASIAFSDIFLTCTTRGQLRMLAKALGIPLTEQL